MARKRKVLFVPPEWVDEPPAWVDAPAPLDIRSGHDLSHTAKIKTYPAAGTWECLTASRPIFHEPGWEPSRDSHVAPRALPEASQEAKTDHSKENLLRSVRRAKVKFRDLALSTEFRYFVTLTLNKEYVDRCDPVAVTKKLNAWLSNMVQRHGLAYILVPELHEKGGIHFHGFFNEALEAVDSGTLARVPDPAHPGKTYKKPRRPADEYQRQEWLAAGAQVVYNLPAWTLGFTTALEIYGSYPAAVGYCCKYIGKDMSGKIGGRWYYSGGDLTRPTVTYADLSAREQSQNPGAYTFEVKEAACCFVKEQGNL